MSWLDLEGWWRDEIAADPAYEEVVTPLLMRILLSRPGHCYLDLGCGDGRVMRAVQATGADVIGVDVVPALARTASTQGPALVDGLPLLRSIRDDAVDGAYAVLVLEHLPGTAVFFSSAARVVRAGGYLGLVINHPIWTAPDSTPITDEDGEVLWRPGDYFAEAGSSTAPAGEGRVVFHHRSMSTLLNLAANAGWSLEELIETPHHEFEDQGGIPRLLACRWRLLR